MLLFSEYIQQQKTLIGQFKSGEALEMSCPFEIKPKKPNGKAVLLIHGFLASPYIMRSIGAFMANQGYLVRAILLPGHGTEFNQLRKVKSQDWLEVCRYGIRSIQTECEIEDISIIGFSMGAILALLMSFEFKISALGLLAPCFEITSLSRIFPTLCRLKLDKILPDLFCTQSEPINYGSYMRFPMCAVVELQKIINLYYKKARKQKTWPLIFGAVSMNDHTIKTEAVIEEFKHFPADTSCLEVYSSKDFKNNPRILTLSHVAIPVSPNDPYFGENGSYYGALPADMQFGEPTWRDKGKAIKRLTYHPDFDSMAARLLNLFQRR